MGALCAQPEGLGRQPSACCVKLLVLGSTKAFVAFLASLDWRSQRGPTHYVDTLLGLFHHQQIHPDMRDRAQEALRLCGAKHLSSKRMDQMSTGEARRVLIARALAPDPGALLLDEPTTGLDLPSRHHFLQMLQNLAKAGKTLILVTHHVEEILPEIERVILIKEGRVFADGAVNTVLTSKNISALFELPVQIHDEQGWRHASATTRV